MPSGEPAAASHAPDSAAAPTGPDDAARTLRNGPVRALVVASIAVALHRLALP